MAVHGVDLGAVGLDDILHGGLPVWNDGARAHPKGKEREEPMMRVMIVDDEKLIWDGLAQLVDLAGLWL